MAPGNTHRPNRQLEEEGGVATETVKKVKRPSLYRVLLHNDDYTTQEFVVHVLMNIFHHPTERAFEIMLNVHQRGIGVAGVYPRDVAEAKAAEVKELAQSEEFPLLCTAEPES